MAPAAEAPDHGHSPAGLAVLSDSVDELAALLAAGTDPNSTSGEPPTALTVWALLAGSPNCFRLLIDSGADIHQVNHDGDSLFHIAGQVNAPGAMLILLDAGVDPGVTNAQGRTGVDYLQMTDFDLLVSEVADDARRVVARVGGAS